MKESLFRGFFAVTIMSLFLWLYACTPTAQRLEDAQGVARLPAQAPPSLSLPSVDLPIVEHPSQTLAPNTSNTPTSRPIFSQVIIEDLGIMIREGFPLRVNAYLTGYIENTCGGLKDIIEYRDQHTFRLELHLIQGTLACSQRKTLNIIVPLDVDGLNSGIYHVEVLNKMAEFEILMDNHDAVGFKQIRH